MTTFDYESSIRAFNTAGGKPVGTAPFYGEEGEKMLDNLIKNLESEIEELKEARAKKDPAEVLDALLDLSYYSANYAVMVYEQGCYTGAIHTVHGANMTKVEGPLLDGNGGKPYINPETGKILKPEGFVAPDITPFAKVSPLAAGDTVRPAKELTKRSDDPKDLVGTADVTDGKAA